MKIIKLTQGKEAIVDDKYYEILIKYRWQTCYNGRAPYYNGHPCYALRTVWNNKTKKHITISMHRLIMELEGHDLKDKEIDHIDRNGLNNQVNNLRVCSRAENLRNRPKQINNKTGFKGVYLRKNAKKYKAKIKINNKDIHLGYFQSKIDAAKAYDQAALKYHGEFAYTNFPKENYVNTN